MKKFGRLLTVWLLVAVGSGCRAYDPQAVEAFDTLAKGDLPAARALYEAGADLDARFQDDMTALMIMASTASADSVDMLLRLGADPNLRSHDGSTALMMAAERGRIEAVRLLIAGGADVHARDDAGRTPRELASAAGHLSVLEILEE